MNDTSKNAEQMILVLGGTGKTGRRVAQRLEARGVPTRIGSRRAERPFDWEVPSTWGPILEGVSAAYIVFHPDLAMPGAPAKIRAFVAQAVASGVGRLVLLSGRGEEEAQRCERIVQEAGVDWTILRASWFAQNFSEGAFLDMVLAGEIALPAGEVGEPFVDADDIADVAVAALTEPGHTNQLYELTGPRLLTFAEAVGEIAAAAGREIRYAPVTGEAFAGTLQDQDVPEPFIELLDYLFREVLDGRNAQLSDGVQRALGRAPRDFTAYAKATAVSGAWNA
jgi:uncharacterized protein YbjT (DUF2867 family)